MRTPAIIHISEENLSFKVLLLSVVKRANIPGSAAPADPPGSHRDGSNVSGSRYLG